MKLKITNNSQNPRALWGTDGAVHLPVGATIEADFAEGDAKNISADTGLKVEGYEPGGDPAPAAGKSGDEVAKLNDEIERLNGEVSRLTAELEAAKAAGGGGEQTNLSLADAVLALDDANDDHWTNGGKPDLAALEKLTGNQVKRAEVDALDPVRERKTA